MTKTKLKKTESGIRQCEMCGALEGLMHHDPGVERVLVELAVHQCALPKQCWVHGRIVCQPCLEGMRESELEKSGTPEGLLAKAARLQTEFWEALGELEAELGIEIESARDLQGYTVEDLMEDEDDDEDAEEEEAACREIVREQKGQEGSK